MLEQLHEPISLSNKAHNSNNQWQFCKSSCFLKKQREIQCCLQFISILEMAYPDSNVSVKIDSIVPGSVVVNTTTTFLDGDQSAANSDAKALATAPGTIFPADTYGDVTTSGVSTGTAANPAGNSHHPQSACQWINSS